MQDPVGSLRRHAVRAACLVLLVASRAFAQAATPEPSPELQFLSRYDFHLSIDGLAVEDPRFSWDARFGGDFDLLDYGLGRLTFNVDYQAVAGKELGAFDVNQGNYTLSAATSARTRAGEIVLVLNHVSRHLSDRQKTMRIAWNEVQTRLLREVTRGATTVDVKAQVGKVVAEAFVDYSWSAELDGTVRRLLSPRVTTYGRARGQTVGVTRETYGREQQYGGRVEGGFRFRGERGALELFGGYERVIDADPLEMVARNWAFAGFRVVTN
jgi:hypothetical protein